MVRELIGGSTLADSRAGSTTGSVGNFAMQSGQVTACFAGVEIYRTTPFTGLRLIAAKALQARLSLVCTPFKFIA